jgi:hypothetical protein
MLILANSRIILANFEKRKILFSANKSSARKKHSQNLKTKLILEVIKNKSEDFFPFFKKESSLVMLFM